MIESPKFPYDRDRCSISQAFGADHDGWDIVPNYKRSDGLPADCYPVFSGRAVSVADTSTSKGKGIKVLTEIWPDLKDYLASKGVMNARQLTVLYWHLLDVIDVDGQVDQGTSVGITGNTGNVWSHGKPVPDSEKGVPPYRGLHLHLETYVDGRPIDPDIIFNYKPKRMNQTKVVLSKDGHTVYKAVPVATSWDEFKRQSEVEGIEIPPVIPSASTL